MRAQKHTMHYQTLEQIDTPLLHRAFVAAFCDYQVNMDFPLADFEKMMQRRGLVPSLSVGAFDGASLVGFSFTGLRVWNGVLTAYDISTGVVPEHRRKGITSELFLREKALLKNKQAQQYLLEVLQENTPATKLYQKQGFTVQRELDCFQAEVNQLKPCRAFKTEKADDFDWRQGQSFWDFAPSWQNSMDSVLAVPADFLYLVARHEGEVAGYGIIDQKTGDIPQLAVNQKFRRMGIGTCLLAQLAESAQTEKIRMLNVEASQSAVHAFLNAAGFERYISQYEMVLPM